MVTQPTRKDNILGVFLTNRPTLTTRSIHCPDLVTTTLLFIVSSASAKRSKPVQKYLPMEKADLVSLQNKGLQFQQYFKGTYTTLSNINTM
ncbi:hypothetical protein DPMN_083116 [Dreissena polymorpha]|uniref:Uncharacterized protein n=1 Tax=Dreissena polymorpha TaxID=45954 RepID=A0A9D3Y879_DREPO|nr:hypothetical protein DPMN_083116 [Dreissena polymorpha]